jgi:PelA/Pel-15E family pectate lyase
MLASEVTGAHVRLNFPQTMNKLIPLVLLGATWSAPAASLEVEATAALAKATAFLRSIATHGGYLWRYSADLKERAGEAAATPSQIWVQPPGTPAVGMAFLRAYEATRDPRYLDAALAAGQALATGQLESGGWDYVVDFDPKQSVQWYRRSDAGKLTPAEAAKRKNISTFDDNTSQSALRFLMALADTARDSQDARVQAVRQARDYGLRKLLEAQFPNGGWPQRWDGKPRDPAQFPAVKATFPKSYPREHPKENYFAHYTLNDGAQRDCILTLLEAHRRTGRAEYLAAARRGADFFLLAQLPEPQPVWAQQYNARMEPAWARAFEPPSVTAGESAGVVRTLVDLYLELGDQRYLDAVPPAIAWFQRSAIAPNRWARLYELHTNKPIYGDRDGKIYYRLQDISQERQKGYGWEGDFGIPRVIKYYQDVQAAGRDAWLASRTPKPLTPAKKAERAAKLEPEIRKIIAALDAQGRWLTQGRIEKRDWKFGDRIETSVFIENVNKLAEYLGYVK